MHAPKGTKSQSAPATQPAVQPRTQRAAPPAFAGAGNQAILRAASAGVDGAGERLPHLERIQAAFGRHDIGHVRAAVGGRAGRAAAQMGATAYTTGHRIAFRESPDVRLAAHEAAHVVQQRAGARIDGSVGRAGDHHERTADAVAEAVIAGRSAQPLLDALLAEPAPGVQRKCDCGGTCERCDVDGLPAVQMQQAPPQPTPSDAGTRPPVSDAGSVAGNAPNEIQFEDRTLTDDNVLVRRVLEDVQTDHGEKRVGQFVHSFKQQVADHRYRLSRSYLSDVHGVPDWIEELRRQLPLEERILPKLQRESADLHRRNENFLAIFEAQARVIVAAALGESESRTTAERDRYGVEVTTQAGAVSHPASGGGAVAYVPPAFKMATTAGSLGLEGAANELAAMLREIRRHEGAMFDAYQSQIGSRVHHEPTGDEITRALSSPAYRAAEARTKAARHEYEVVKSDRTRAYPILGAFAPDAMRFGPFDVAKLERLGEGRTPQAASLLGTEIDRSLGDIRETRNNLRDGDLTIWSLPNIVAITKNILGANAMQRRLVDDKAKDVDDKASFVTKALGALAVALGLLAAIPTGGASLLVVGLSTTAAVGAAVTSTALAVHHVREYEIQSAAHGTDLDKARAISAAEPSLFWLALDMIGAGLDIVGAGAAFKTFAGGVRRAIMLRRIARGGEAATRALEELLAAIERAHPGTGLAGRVADDIIRRAGQGERVEAAIAHWEQSVNQQTRGFLVDNPRVRTTYVDMDDLVRQILTHCSDLCIIPGATRQHAARLRALIDRLQLSSEELGYMREYFHIRRTDVGAALDTLERLASVGQGQVRRRLVQALERAENVVHTTVAATAKATPGIVTGGQRLPRIRDAGEWLRGTHGEAGLIPRQVANRLRGRAFNSFRDLRAAIWQEIAANPELAAQFTPQNLALMRSGRAPFPRPELMTGTNYNQRVYNIHHIDPVEGGGAVYDLDNLLIAAPAYHDIIHY